MLREYDPCVYSDGVVAIACHWAEDFLCSFCAVATSPTETVETRRTPVSDWRPHRDPKAVGPFEVQYMTSSAHAHEGAHRIAVDGVEVLVLPDGRTTARNRSAVITRVLEAVPDVDSAAILNPAARLVFQVRRVWTVLGGLVLQGLTSIEVNGEPILPEPGDRVASIRLDVRQGDAGLEISLTDLGGTGAQR